MRGHSFTNYSAASKVLLSLHSFSKVGRIKENLKGRLDLAVYRL